MRGVLFLSLAELAGCAQLAGIDETSGNGLDGVSLDVERVSIGATVLHNPQDLSAQTATYFLADGSRVMADQPSPGLWTADIFGETPPVLFSLPDNPPPAFPRLFDYPSKDLKVAFDRAEHLNPTPVDLTSMLMVSVTLDRPIAAETWELFVVGTWDHVTLPAGTATAMTYAPPPFAMSSMASLTGREIEKITPDDIPLVIRRTGTKLDGVFEVPAFEQTGANTLSGALPTIAADQNLAVNIAPATAVTRFTATRPVIAATNFNWNLTAAPGAVDALSTLGPSLESGAAMMADTGITATYANPFKQGHNWLTTLTWQVTGSRTTMPDGTNPLTLSAGLIQRVAEPVSGQTLDLPAGLPTAISIDGKGLLIDNQVQLTQPTAPVEVTIVTDRDPATLYSVEVFEVVLNTAGTAFELHRVLAASALLPSIKLPPETFTAGKRYVLRAGSTVGGFPNVAAGDLRTRAFPVSVAFFDSGVFEVVP